MSLALTLPSGGYLRLNYQGPLEVSGVSVAQPCDLTALPKSVRAQPGFKRSIIIFARPLDAGLTAVEAEVTFDPPTGVPETMIITVTASDPSDEIALDVWCLHAFIGAISNASKLYFFGAGGGGGGAVSSVFGRIGAVVAVAGDYLASQITNNSSVVGATVQAALNTLNALVPTAGEKAALSGTSGTPSGSNLYVTNADPRNTNARTPTTHATSHLPGGSDPLTTAAAGTIAVADSAAVGTAESFARSDHRHALPAPATPAAQVIGAGTAGVATTVARADHVHPMVAQAPGATPVETVTAATYSIVAADANKIKRFTNAGGCEISLPAAAGDIQVVLDIAEEAGDCTLVPVGTTINGDTVGPIALTNGPTAVSLIPSGTTTVFDAVGGLATSGTVSLQDAYNVDSEVEVADGVPFEIESSAPEQPILLLGSGADEMTIHVGATSPDGVVSAAAGSLYVQTADGTSTLWQNNSVGTGTSWLNIAAAATVSLQDAYDVNAGINVADGAPVEIESSAPDQEILRLGSGTDEAAIFVGASSPNGVVTADAGSLYVQTAGASSTLWQNTSAGSGTTWTEVTGGGSGDLPIAFVTGFSDSRYYELATDPFIGEDNWTAAVMFNSRYTEGRLARLFGTQTGGPGTGGANINIFGNAGQIQAQANDNVGGNMTAFWDNQPMSYKWIMAVMRYRQDGADTVLSLSINGDLVSEARATGVTGPYTAGIALGLGACSDGAGFGSALENVNGAGYALRALTDEEISEWYRDSYEAGQFLDIPSGGSLTAGWRANGTDPGATWAPFVGAGNLTRTGTAVTPGTDTRPDWK